MLSTFQESFWSPHGEARAIWRVGVKDWEGKREEDREFARHRHSTTVEFSSQERRLARQRRQQRRRARAAELRASAPPACWQTLEADSSASVDPPAPLTELPTAEPEDDEPSDGPGTVGGAPSPRALDCEPVSPTTAKRSTGPRQTVLSRIMLRSDKMSRIQQLKESRRTRRRDEQQRQAHEERLKAFEEKPSEERQAFRAAFDSAAGDDSSALGWGQLVKACHSLGLVPRSNAEKREFHVICHEITIMGEVDFMGFVYEAVPQVRGRLRELRRAALQQHFNSFDNDSSGYLSENECRTILDRVCAGNLDPDGREQMQAAFSTILLSALDPETGEVSFENFETLVATAQEQCQRVVRERSEDIRSRENLRPNDVEGITDDLITMHDLFVRTCVRGPSGEACRPCEKGLLEPRGLKSLLIEYGLLPAKGTADWCLNAYGLKEGAPVTFKEFVGVVRMMRQFRRMEDSGQRKAMFDTVDRDGSGNLSLLEVFGLISEMGLSPTCRDEQIEMQSLIASMDADSSEELNAGEFEGLIQELEDRMRRKERMNLWTLSAELGLSDLEVFVVREAFHALDVKCAGTLSIESVRSLLDCLRMTLSGERLKEMFQELDPVRGTELDILGFLRFVGLAKIDLRRLDALLARGSVGA